MKAKTTGLPYVTVKWAMTLDGRIASASGDSKWITGELARRHVHRTRNEVDAVLVGIGTALKDDPLLTSRIPGGRDPARIILDRGARLPLNSQLVRTAGEVPVIVVATGKALRSLSEKLAQAGCRVLQLRAKADGRVSIKALLRRLGKMGFIHLLVEGGQGVFSEFFQARQVDRVQVYVSPKLLGEGLAPLDHAGTVHMQNALKAADVKAHRFGEDLLLEGTLSWEKMQEV